MVETIPLNQAILIRFTGPIISFLGVLSAVNGYLKNTAANESNEADNKLVELSSILKNVDRASGLIHSIQVLFARHQVTDEFTEMGPISAVWLLSELRSEISLLHRALSDLYPSISEDFVEDCRVLETRLNSMQAEDEGLYILKTEELLSEGQVYLAECESELLKLA